MRTFRRSLLLLICLLNVGFTSYAQKADSLLALNYAQIADTSYMNVDTSIRYTYLALPLLQKTQQWELYVRTYAGLSYCYNVKGFLDSLTIVNQEASAAAEQYLPARHPLRVATQNNLGIVYKNVHQNYLLALEYFESALSLFDANKMRIGFKANILKNIGEIHVLRGDFELAERYFRDAFATYSVAFKDPFYEHLSIEFRIGEVYQDLARVARYQEDYADAQAYLLDLLQLMETNARPFASSYYLSCYTQLAEVMLNQAAGGAAEGYIERAFALTDLTKDQQAEIYEVQSHLLATQERWEAAIRAINSAIENMSADKAVDLAERHRLKARYLSAMGQQELAVQTAIMGLEILAEGTAWQDLEQKPVSEWNLLSPLTGIRLLNERATILQKWADETHDLALLDDALRAYHYLSDLGDQLRGDYQSEESKLFLNANAHQFYEAAIELTYQLHQQTGDPDYVEQAFFFFEKSKAAVLLEELRAREAEGLTAIPVDVLAAGQQLRIEANYHRKLIAAEKARVDGVDQHKIDSWNRQLLRLSRERERWEQKIADTYPNYLVYTRPEIPSLQEVRRILGDQEGIVSYFVGQNEWYAIFLSKDEVQFQQVDQPEVLVRQQQTVLGNLKMTGQNGIVHFAEAAHLLYQQLLASFPLRDLEKLIVIPDGQLSFLPFDLLLTEPVGEADIRNFPFLFRALSINFAYSWAVLHLQSSVSVSANNLLHVAPLFSGQSDRYLPHSGKPLPATANWQVASLVDTAATTGNFSRLVHRYDLIHFASHATAYDSVFHQPAIDFIDASLYLQDLQSMRLSAHLVVLSACEAGIGNVQRGEGMMSLARGFAYAGVPSVVSTLWRVNEVTTHNLLNKFYQHLQNGEAKDNALRLAKVDFLEQCSDTQLAPYYWAGLVTIGDGRPIVKAGTGMVWLMWLGSLLLLFVGWRFANRLRKGG